MMVYNYVMRGGEGKKGTFILTIWMSFYRTPATLWPHTHWTFYNPLDMMSWTYHITFTFKIPHTTPSLDPNQDNLSRYPRELYG